MRWSTFAPSRHFSLYHSWVDRVAANFDNGRWWTLIGFQLVLPVSRPTDGKRKSTLLSTLWNVLSSREGVRRVLEGVFPKCRAAMECSAGRKLPRYLKHNVQRRWWNLSHSLKWAYSEYSARETTPFQAAINLVEPLWIEQMTSARFRRYRWEIF